MITAMIIAIALLWSCCIFLHLVILCLKHDLSVAFCFWSRQASHGNGCTFSCPCTVFFVCITLPMNKAMYASWKWNNWLAVCSYMLSMFGSQTVHWPDIGIVCAYTTASGELLLLHACAMYCRRCLGTTISSLVIIVQYRDTLRSPLRKQLNRSRCRLDCGLGVARGIVNHMGCSSPHEKGQFSKIVQIGTFCRQLYRNSWTDWLAVRFVDLGGPKEIQVQSYLSDGANVPSRVAILAPRDKYKWSVRLQWWCSLVTLLWTVVYIAGWLCAFV